MAPALARTFASGSSRHQRAHVLIDALVFVQFVELMLGEIGDPQLVGAGDVAAHRCEPLRQQFHQRRLAIAVGAQEARCGRRCRCAGDRLRRIGLPGS